MKKSFIKTIALVGNPNCGKTTLYNLLTKSGEATGNRAGVTFAPKEAALRRFGHEEASIVDLPGIYSLSPYGNEEKIADHYIKRGEADVIIDIADATNLERSLFLTLQLIFSGVSVVLALNMMDEAEKEHVSIDISALSEALGIPVFPISAARADGIEPLVASALSLPKPSQHLKMAPNAGAEQLSPVIEKILHKSVLDERQSSGRGDKVDRIICRPYVGIPLFFLMLFCIFSLTFSSAGKWMSDLLGSGFSLLAQKIGGGLANFGVAAGVCNFITDGIFAGIGAVLSFLPQTAILFLLLEILEDTGYMARAAFVMDSTLCPFGLSGKAFIPMLIGFGCTVPATMSTVTLEPEEKETVIYSLPFIPCSARFPVFAMIIAAFFEEHAGLAAFLIYTLGIIAAILSAFFHTKTGHGRAAPPLTIELPKYRMPRLRNLMRGIGSKLRDFITRAGSIVFLSCVIVYILGALTPALKPATGTGESILAAIGSFFTPIMRPIGLGDPRIISALAAGFFAKESIVSTLEILTDGAIAGLLTKAGAASFAVFSLLYAPCAATLSAIRKELGTAKAITVLFRCILTAYAVSYIIYMAFRIFFPFA